MTLEGFTALNLERKMEATLDGVCIGGRAHEGYMVLLYQMSAFYVEVWYNKVHHFVSDLVAFDSTDNLAPYLGKIEIADLLT